MAYQEIIFSPPESMQDALTKVNENFVELYNNPAVNIGTMVGIDPANPTVCIVDSTKTIYEVDCSGGDVTALFDLSTDSNKLINFKRIDASSYLFRIDEVSGSPLVDGNALPYDTGAQQWDNIKIYNNGSNFGIL